MSVFIRILDQAISTVDQETIQRHDAHTLSEAMDFSPGVLTESRGRKVKQFSSFRGQIYPYPDYALNGIWQRSFRELPYIFPAAAIDRIETLRSGGAIMVGPNAGLVGAINVVPRRFDEPTTLFDVQGGSHRSFRSTVVHGDRSDRGYLTLGASRYSTDGPSDENAAERFGSLFLTGGFDVNEKLTLEITGFYMDGERELRKIQDPGRVDIQGRSPEEYSPYEVSGGTLRALYTHSERASTEVDFGYIRRSGHYERDPDPSRNNHDLDWEYNAGVLHALNLAERNTLRFGVQYNHWVAPQGKRQYSGTTMNVQTISGVIMDEHQFDRLTIDGGIRWTRLWYRDFANASFNITGARLMANPIEDTWGDPMLTGTLGAKYRMTEVTSLYSHLAVGTVDAPKGAVADDGSSTVDKETRYLFDAGVSLEDDTLGTLKMGIFGSLREDAILLSETSVTQGGDDFNTYSNNDVRQYGCELEWQSARYCDLFNLYTAASLMNSLRYTDGSWSNYKEIPDQILTGGIYLKRGAVDINLFGKYVSRYENRRFVEGGVYKDLGDFVDVNLTAGYSFGEDEATRVYCSLENLLDDEYSTVAGYPDYGFQAFIGIQHRM